MNRKGPEDYQAMARLRGARWLGPVVGNANTRTQWECRDCRHRWWAIYNSLLRGTGCPMCGIIKRSRSLAKAPSDYTHLGHVRGFLWRGPAVQRTSHKTGWQCPLGHAWQATYDKIRWGRGCPTCAREAAAERSRQHRHSPARYHGLALHRGFRWLGPEVTNAGAKTRWECRRVGHRWSTSYKINHGRGCPRCALRSRADFFRHPEGDYHRLAGERGFTWIGPRVLTVAKKTWWRCPKEHSWRATYNSIQQGSGCHVCQDRVNGLLVSQTQRLLCRRLGGKLNQRVGRYAVDVALRQGGSKIAIEFDSWYYHGGREDTDRRWDQRLLDAGWRVLRIRSPGPLPLKQELDAAIKRTLAGESYVVITLPGWGEGPTRAPRKREE